MRAALAEPLVLEGQARVVDNTTLEIWGHRIRLDDIVDPASSEGRDGRRYLERLVSGVTVRCVISGISYGDARVGQCAAGTLDIGAALVEFGYARRQTARQPGR